MVFIVRYELNLGQKTAPSFEEAVCESMVLVYGFLRSFGVVLRWNNGLREAVVKVSFLFLSTFFIQCLTLY